MAHSKKVLLWKMYIMRKRRWFISAMEIGLPLVLFGFLIHIKNLMPSDKEKIIFDTYPNPYNTLDAYDPFKIAYTPPNDFTNAIMNGVMSRLKSFQGVTIVSQPSEDKVVQWLREQYINETRTSSSADFGFNSDQSAGIGVIFLETEDTTNLKYVLRTTRAGLLTSENTIYGGDRSDGYAYVYGSGFTTIQAAIDITYLSLFHNINVTKDVLIKQLPTIQFMSADFITILLPYVITFGFTFVMQSLMRGIIEEKKSGIKEMMKIMGLKSFTNWVSWVVYSLLVYVPVTFIITCFLTVDSGSGPALEANLFIVWIFFLLFTLAFITLILAATTFFTNGTIALIVGYIVWYVVSIGLNLAFVSHPDKYSLSIHLVTCLWPSVAIQWGINTICNFQKNGYIWTVSDMFDDGAGGGRVSVGLAAIMLIVDILLYSLITWYMDNVNPGPYGRAKPLTFIFKRFMKEDYDPKSAHVTGVQNNYEPTPPNTKIGIRIENLRKTFNNGKVVAVENVDLDIYEGNITALLGHNGAGKTTTMSILTGFLTPSRGKVIVKGKNIFENMDDFRSNLGLCPQHNLVFSFFTVLEHLMFFGMLKGMPINDAEREGHQLLRTLKIDGKKDELVSKLSGGMKRKLCLAIALMGDPEILMLDEPTSGLDPESRRQVWDMLLGFRGQRTTLITTHFMEEADVLGDRIAIMDHGQVSCYGTTIFLKRLYGTGYHLNISKAEQAAEPAISRIIDQYVSSAAVKVCSPTQLTYSIKADESVQFPALFSALDSWRGELGLTAISVDCTTMEDVFLKVVEEPDQVNDSNGYLGHNIFFDSLQKVTGLGLIFLQFKALLYIRLLTRLRSWISSLIFLIIPVLLVIRTIRKSMESAFDPNQPNLLINLASFPAVHVAAASTNDAVTTVIENLVNAGKGIFEQVQAGSNLDNYLADKIRKNFVQYERHMIVGFEYSSLNFTGAYSSYFYHSPALIRNMIPNILLSIANSKSTITVYNHPISVKASEDICNISMLSQSHTFLFPMITTTMTLGFIILLINFIALPLKERVSKSKQLQLMTGVSPVLYWITTFLCDFVLYLITVVIMVAMIYIFQDHSIYSASGYMGTLVIVFIFFGISGIGFAYFFSFIAKTPIKAAVIFIMINLITGVIASTFLALLGQFYTDYDAFIWVLSFNPIFAASSAFIHLLTVMYINGSCVQCGRNCKTQDPLQFLETGLKSQNPNGIYNFLVFLAVDALIYFTLVLFIEYGITKKLRFLVSKLWIKMSDEMLEEDSDVLLEKEKVKSSQSLRGYVSNTSVLRVIDLGKKYNRKTTSVHGVTFEVGEGECFGLLGVNGAGKTTTFKMLTGEEIPNKGDATILHHSLRSQKTSFLAKIGYCPQFDAINKLLTGKEMLQVYALLRGISSQEREAEVSKWIQIMGLKEYADRPCGTYSGGNKRKLSTAMAFIGDPPVVFLDEPTSGVDPVSRRKLWDVMIKCQQAGQCVVLTSHSMDECEALCSRITIMVAGQMKCIGSAQYLKQKFGQGYTVKIKLFPSQQLQLALGTLKRDVINHFRDCSIKDEHLGLLHYHIRNPSIRLSELFTKMELLKRRHDIIEDYIVSDTTLEQVFMSFARPNTSTDL